MVSVGLLGCGRWGKLILRDLKLLGAKVAVLVKNSSSHGNAVTGGADSIVERFEELPDVDAYVVAMPTALHAEFIDKAIPTHKPVFCEKPLTHNIEAARSIVAEAGDRIFVMDKWRYHGGVLALKAIANSEELGPVLGIKTTRVQWGYPHQDVEMDWILLPHDLTIALEILGFVPQPQSAVAEISACGLVGLFGLLQSEGVWMDFEVGIRSRNHRRMIELRCRNGVASLSDAYDESVGIIRTSGCTDNAPTPQIELRPVNVDMPLMKELDAFLRYVQRQGPPPRSSAAEGLVIVERISTLRLLAGLST